MATATMTAGAIAWKVAKALAIAGATAEAAKYIQENYEAIKKLGLSDEYINEIIKNPEKMTEADEAWQKSEEETLYPTEQDENTSKYATNYENTLKANNKLTAKPSDFEFTEDQTIGEMLPGPGTEEYDKGKLPGIPNDEEEGIIDTTRQNEDMPIGENFNMEAYKQLRDEAWAREDAIRKETQAREDTAWQRSVEDAQKAGINVNLLNMQPAASGGGITSATGIDTSAGKLDLEKYLTELEGILDRELKADEGTKDRISDLISALIFAGAMLMK